MSAAEKDINTALSVRLAELQTAGVPPVAWENAEYTPVEGSLYLRESFLPNIKDAVGVAHTSADDYEGLYQVSVMDGRGDRRFDAQEQARLISLHFPRGAEYTYNGVTVKITGTRLASAITEDGWYQIPVTISWRALV
ncbi:MAG: phage tail terminator-like protein [Pseudohongiellaceae bacterium]|jgi:hypothetical protein